MQGLTPQGVYSGVCESIGMDTSKNGTELIDVIFNVTMQAMDGEWVAIKPLSRHIRIYLSDAAWESSTKKLDLLKFDGNFLEPKITGEMVVLECNHETYNNKVGEKWELSGFNSERERTPPPQAVLTKLTARYQSDRGPGPISTPPPVTSPSSPQTSQSVVPEDDTIPF